MERFQRGLVFKANRLLHYSTLGSKLIKKNPQSRRSSGAQQASSSMKVGNDPEVDKV